jgi:hypothetical protein
VIITTSPNCAASAAVPADARGPSGSTSGASCSGRRDAKRTSCPASTHNRPTVEPIIPAPIIPIRIANARWLPVTRYPLPGVNGQLATGDWQLIP